MSMDHMQSGFVLPALVIAQKLQPLRVQAQVHRAGRLGLTTAPAGAARFASILGARA